jgi:hypothetical protein
MFFSRLCQTIFLGALALTGLLSVAPVVEAQTNDSVGFCLPISNNVNTSIGLIRFDTYYDNPQWNKLEKASYDPVPFQGNYNICDNIGYSLGSFYIVQAQLYYIDSNGTHVVMNDTHRTVYFNTNKPRVTADWVNQGLDVWQVMLSCSDSGC